MYERILVTLDGSTRAEAALPHAVAHAQHFQSELTLLKVIEPLQDHTALRTAGKRATQMVEDLVRDYLKGISDEIIAEGVAVEIAVIQGEPYIEIVRYAEEHQMDLIVMSTRGQSGVSRWLLGSVSDRVVRGANVPVLLVQAHVKE
jgi:nucleotide-binding universal stress UspA family protein